MSLKLLILVLGILIATVCFAEQPTNGAASGAIKISELPAPPPLVADLLERADVQFTYGPQEKPKAVTVPNASHLDALTVYKLTYEFRSQSRWEPGRNRKHVVTTIRLSRTGLTCKHTVWFREHPQPETFWTNRLVLHEMDHIRISSDPAIERRFKEMLRDKPMITQHLKPNGTLGLKQVNQLADKHAAEIFSEVSSLIEIRYRELDRLTDHGKMNLPDNLPLDSILNSPQ